MTPPIATGVSSYTLDSISNNKKVCPNSLGNNNSKFMNSKINSTIQSNRHKTLGLASSTSLFDTVSIEKSHANQALVDLYKLYDLNGIQVNSVLIDHFLKLPENVNMKSYELLDESVDQSLNDNSTSIKATINIRNENKAIQSDQLELYDKNSNEVQITLKTEKRMENGRKLRENVDSTIIKDKINNDNYNICTNSFPDISRKSINISVNNDIRHAMFTKSKIRIKSENSSKGQGKSNDITNDCQYKSNGKVLDALSMSSTPKQNIMTNTYYCKTENSLIRNSILKTSIIDCENMISLNCINPVQIFPYKLTLKRIKSELSDSEEEIDVVSVNLNKNSNTGSNCNNKICLQESSNNIFIIKKNNIKTSTCIAQSHTDSTEVQLIRNDLINNSDKCSLLADILKTPLNYSKNVTVKRELPTKETSESISQQSSNLKKTVSSSIINTNKIKYPIQIYSNISSINSNNKDLLKNKLFKSKVIKSNLVNLNHKRSVKSGSISNTTPLCSKKNYINSVISKNFNKKPNNIIRNQPSLIITQRSVKVSSNDQIKSIWKNKRLKRKLSDKKSVKKTATNYPIADSEESSNEDNDDESDSSSSTLSNYSSKHSSGWSSPLEYSSSSESLDKPSNIMSSFDLNIINQKLCKKSNEKLEISDWSIYSNISDLGYSDTCSSLCSEQINTNFNTTYATANNNGNINFNNSSLKRNRSYTSGYSSDNPAEKRAFHILSERQRRNDLKKLFETLRTNVPNLSDKQKASKLTILKAAVDFLADVSSKQIKLSTAYEKEKQRHLQLIQNLKVLQSNMK